MVIPKLTNFRNSRLCRDRNIFWTHNCDLLIKTRIFPECAKPCASWSRRFRMFSYPIKCTVLRILKSVKSKFPTYHLYHFQNFFQSNTPLAIKLHSTVVKLHAIFFPANEPPDPAMEQAGILSLQAQELTVDHSVSALLACTRYSVSMWRRAKEEGYPPC